MQWLEAYTILVEFLCTLCYVPIACCYKLGKNIFLAILSHILFPICFKVFTWKMPCPSLKSLIFPINFEWLGEGYSNGNSFPFLLCSSCVMTYDEFSLDLILDEEQILEAQNKTRQKYLSLFRTFYKERFVYHSLKV